MQSGIDPDISMAALRDGRAEAAILARRRGKSYFPEMEGKRERDVYEIAWMGSLGNNNRDILLLLKKFMQMLVQKLPIDAVIDIAAVKSSTEGLIKKLFGAENLKKRLMVSQVMHYVRILDIDDVISYYTEGSRS